MVANGPQSLMGMEIFSSRGQPKRTPPDSMPPDKSRPLPAWLSAAIPDFGRENDSQ
jgi:hypothetical protein